MPTVPPDLSNLVKSAEDALNKIVWKDDAQVVELHTKKIWCQNQESPQILVVVETIECGIPKSIQDFLIDSGLELPDL